MAEVAEKYQYVISSDRSVQKEVIELKRHIRSKLNVQLKMKAGYSQMQVCAASLSVLIQTFKCTVAASLHAHKRAVASRFAGDFREDSRHAGGSAGPRHVRHGRFRYDFPFFFSFINQSINNTECYRRVLFGRLRRVPCVAADTPL